MLPGIEIMDTRGGIVLVIFSFPEDRVSCFLPLRFVPLRTNDLLTASVDRRELIWSKFSKNYADSEPRLENKPPRDNLDFPCFHVTADDTPRQTRPNTIFANPLDSWTSPPPMLFAYRRGTDYNTGAPLLSFTVLLFLDR